MEFKDALASLNADLLDHLEASGHAPLAKDTGDDDSGGRRSESAKITMANQADKAEDRNF